MLEHNRNLKILIEKHNYLLGQGAGDCQKQRKAVIEATKEMLSESRRLEQVKQVISNPSRQLQE